MKFMSYRDPKALQAQISRAEARLAELDDERRHVWRHLSALKAELSSVQRLEDQRQSPQQVSDHGFKVVFVGVFKDENCFWFEHLPNLLQG